MHWLYYLILLAVQLAGILLNIVNLPGLWLMALAAGIYGWATKLQYLSWKTIIALLVLALVAELIEFFSSTAGAKRAGASRRGLVGAVIGGIVGAIFLSLPFPVIGTFAGVLIGTFLGALIAELTVKAEVGKSIRVGVGAAKGRFVGTMSKLAVGVVMFLLTLWVGFPVNHSAGQTAPVITPARPPQSAPTTVPTTVPTTTPSGNAIPGPGVWTR